MGTRVYKDGQDEIHGLCFEWVLLDHHLLINVLYLIETLVPVRFSFTLFVSMYTAVLIHCGMSVSCLDNNHSNTVCNLMEITCLAMWRMLVYCLFSDWW